jgi:hypothetical protein
LRRTTAWNLLLVLALAATLSACGSGATVAGGASYPGTDEGAEALLKEFPKPGADVAPALTQEME